MFLTSIRGLNLNIDNWVQCTEEYANEVLDHVKFLNNINADAKSQKF